MLSQLPPNNAKGVSVVELLVAIAIIVGAVAGLLALAVFSMVVANIGQQTTQAALLAQETMEAARNFRDGTDWATNGLGTLILGTDYYPAVSAGQWQLLTGTETIGEFTRQITFEEVFRDGNDDIASSGTSDPDTLKALVEVSWQERGRSHEVALTAYLTNWNQ